MSSNNPNSYQHGMIDSRQNGLGWSPRGNSNNVIHNRISAGAYSNNLHPHDMRPMMNYSQIGYRGPSMGNHYRFYNFPPRGMGPKGAPKTEEAPKKPKQDDPEDDEWKSIPGGRPGDWLCKKCGKHNFSKNKFNCFFCKTPRNPEKAEKDKSNEPIVPGSYRDYLRRKELGELDQEPPPWDSSGVADPSEVPEVVNDEVPPTPAQQADDDDYYDDAPDMGKY